MQHAVRLVALPRVVRFGGGARVCQDVPRRLRDFLEQAGVLEDHAQPGKQGMAPGAIQQPVPLRRAQRQRVARIAQDAEQRLAVRGHVGAAPEATGSRATIFSIAARAASRSPKVSS